MSNSPSGSALERARAYSAVGTCSGDAPHLLRSPPFLRVAGN